METCISRPLLYIAGHLYISEAVHITPTPFNTRHTCCHTASYTYFLCHILDASAALFHFYSLQNFIIVSTENAPAAYTFRVVQRWFSLCILYYVFVCLLSGDFWCDNSGRLMAEWSLHDVLPPTPLINQENFNGKMNFLEHERAL